MKKILFLVCLSACLWACDDENESFSIEGTHWKNLKQHDEAIFFTVGADKLRFTFGVSLDDVYELDYTWEVTSEAGDLLLHVYKDGEVLKEDFYLRYEKRGATVYDGSVDIVFTLSDQRTVTLFPATAFYDKYEKN